MTDDQIADLDRQLASLRLSVFRLGTGSPAMSAHLMERIEHLQRKRDGLATDGTPPRRN